MLPHIYIILQYLKMGGIEVISVNLANAFNKLGYNVTVISLVKCDDLKYKLNKGINVEYVSKIKPSNTIFYKIGWRIMLRKLGKKISRIRNSVIISSNDTFNVLLSKRGDISSLKIGQLHHDYWDRTDLIYNFKNKYSGLDYFALLTEDVRNEIEDIMTGYNKHTKCITISNFQPDKHSDNRINNTTPQKFNKSYCIAVGRLSTEKGLERLIQIWDYMNKNYNYIPELLIVGDGDQRKNLLKSVNDFGLKNKVHLVGQKDNEEVQKLIQNAICFCMTSYTEGFPLVLLEALNVGTPQIAFDVRVGPRNIILDNLTGYLVKDGDIEDYSKKIMYIFNNKNIRESFSINSKKRSEDFSESRIMNVWEKVICQYFNNHHKE